MKRNLLLTTLCTLLFMACSKDDLQEEEFEMTYKLSGIEYYLEARDGMTLDTVRLIGISANNPNPTHPAYFHIEDPELDFTSFFCLAEPVDFKIADQDSMLVKRPYYSRETEALNFTDFMPLSYYILDKETTSKSGDSGASTVQIPPLYKLIVTRTVVRARMRTSFTATYISDYGDIKKVKGEWYGTEYGNVSTVFSYVPTNQ